jgi:ATP-dependent RNA helicase DeaD
MLDAGGCTRTAEPPWRSSSRRRANWRCRCSANSTWLYADTQARASSPASAAWIPPRAPPARDGAHIVVGTPGRLRDHIERGALDCRISAQGVVLDEADEMLDIGFREDLEFILHAAPEERRTLLFSATMPDRHRGAGQALPARCPAHRGRRRRARPRRHRIPRHPRLPARDRTRRRQHVALLEPKRHRILQHARAVRHLHATLQERGFSAVCCRANSASTSATSACRRCATGGRASASPPTSPRAASTCRNLALVIHAELPHDAEVMQHRSGRTGRAGNKGVSVLLVPTTRRRRAESLLAEAGIRAEWTGPPTADDIRPSTASASSPTRC